MEYVDVTSPLPPDAIEQLVQQFGGEQALLRAAISASFFLRRAKVSHKCVYPNVARHSRKLYPNRSRGDIVKVGDLEIVLDFNHRAQDTWKKVAGVFKRKSGYGVRHIWGHASDPKAYTATWNLCYMPFWAGMLTEDQHPHIKLPKIVQQISFDLYFRDGPILREHWPTFVTDPGLNLAKELPADTVVHLV